MDGLTRAQSAALEAFEEAGVHGRIEQDSFMQYTLCKQEPAVEIMTHAHLCEVWRLGPPEESNRAPTWFSPKKAQLRLQEGRAAHNARQLAQVVEQAVNRILRFEVRRNSVPDPLQRVHFEPSGSWGDALIARLAVLPYASRKIEKNATTVEGEIDPRKALRLRAAATRKLFTPE